MKNNDDKNASGVPEEMWRLAILPSNSTIQEAIKCLDRAATKIVMVVNSAGQIVGTISDGDIRRGLLRGLSLHSEIDSIIHHNPLLVLPEMSREAVIQLMIANKVMQIPVIDESRKVVGLHLWDEITVSPHRPNTMVIMAGGKGTRLRPYTESCPKPMLLVAGKPMLEHIIERAKLDGFSNFVLSIHYLGHLIEDYFADGSKLSVNISYLKENEPLGTAGALSLLPSRPVMPFVVTNGDVLTDIRYGELLDFHLRHAATATMAVRTHEWQNPFGVVQINGIDIVGFEEKPIMRSHINAGVYVLDPSALEQLPPHMACDMPTLFERLQNLSLKTVAYPMHEPWLDVGRPDDLANAHDIIIRNRS